MIIDLKELYSLQLGLDEEIASKHNVSYESTFHRRLLALLVELGELANETRCFKYWSNKSASDKETIIDEYVDGLHFLLSLGIPLKTDKYVYEFSKSYVDLSKQFLNLYSLVSSLHEHYEIEQYIECFNTFLTLGASLGFTSEDIIKAYKNKLEINYQRQNNNY